MSKRPNVVVLMSDQQRLDTVSCYGLNYICKTPHIDALGACGVRYEQAYSEHPVCVPARNSPITGMNAIKTGVLDNGQGLRPDHRPRGPNTRSEGRRVGQECRQRSSPEH